MKPARLALSLAALALALAVFCASPVSAGVQGSNVDKAEKIADIMPRFRGPKKLDVEAVVNNPGLSTQWTDASGNTHKLLDYLINIGRVLFCFFFVLYICTLSLATPNKLKLNLNFCDVTGIISGVGIVLAIFSLLWMIFRCLCGRCCHCWRCNCCCERGRDTTGTTVFLFIFLITTFSFCVVGYLGNAEISQGIVGSSGLNTVRGWCALRSLHL